MSDVLTPLDKTALLHSVLDGIGDGVILTDTKENIIYINGAASNILNCISSSTIGRRFSKICPLQHLPSKTPLESPVLRAIREERPVGLKRDAGILDLFNNAIYLSATCSPIWNTDGGISGCSIILRNITRIHRLELQLEEERRSLKVIFTAAGVGMCMLDSTGAINELNDAAQDILQSSHDTAIGRQFGDAFRCANSLENGCGCGTLCSSCPVRRNIEKALADDKYSGHFTVPMHRLKGQQDKIEWLNIFISQAWSDGQKQLVLSMVDISERKQKELALEQARLAAEAASRAKGQFLANMSHEIRTPINGMIGMIDLTLQAGISGELQENLISAKQCSEDLLRIINDILDFSKLESGKLQLEEIRFDLPELLRRISSVHKKIASDKGLLFNISCNGLPKYVRGDPLRLRQILHNLITNAIKFTFRGSITITATVLEQKEQRLLCFAVKDTGIGMKSDDLSKLFRAFSQVDGSTTRRFGGTGLGLMIVKDLLDCMGGTIKVTSAPDIGSTFTFSIPCREETGADEEIRDKTVFLNPQAGLAAPQSESIEDISELLQYCERRLQD